MLIENCILRYWLVVDDHFGGLNSHLLSDHWDLDESEWSYCLTRYFIATNWIVQMRTETHLSNVTIYTFWMLFTRSCISASIKTMFTYKRAGNYSLTSSTSCYVPQNSIVHNLSVWNQGEICWKLASSQSLDPALYFKFMTTCWKSQY